MTRRRFVKISAVAAGAAIVAAGRDLGAQDSLESAFLLDLEITTGARRSVASVGGTRIIVPVVGGTFDGPKLKGTINEPSGDWIMQRSDGSNVLDVRLPLRTNDEQSIYMAWRGIASTPLNGSLNARIAPTFEESPASVR
jgi:uncharacterized protein DUF3237